MGRSAPATTAAGGHLRVVIADDAPDARILLRMWLDQRGSFEVVGEAGDGAEAVEVAERLHPDLVLLDVAMPGMDGLEAAAVIRAQVPESRIVMLSALSARRMAQHGVDAGADAYLEKGSTPDLLFETIDRLFPAAAYASPAPSPPMAVADARLQLLLDNLGEGVLVVGPTGQVELANAAATTLLGIPSRHVAGWPVGDVLAGAMDQDGRPFTSASPDPVRAALAGGARPSDAVIGVARPGGTVAWLSVSAVPLAPGPGRRSGVLASLRDVTETHALRDELDRLLAALPAPVALMGAVRDSAGEVIEVCITQANPAAAVLTGWEVGERLVGSLAGRREALAAADLLGRFGDACERGEVAVTPEEWQPWTKASRATGLEMCLSRGPGDDVVLTWRPAPSSPSYPGLAAEFLEVAVVSSPVGIVLLDRAGQPILANGVADDLLARVPLLDPSVAAPTLHEVGTGEPASDAAARIRRACAGEPVDDVETVVTNGAGVSVAVRARSVLDHQGRPAGAVLTLVDETEHRRMEDELRASEQRLDLLVDGVLDYGIFMLDVQGRVATWNTGAARLFGYRAEDILGQHLSRFFPPDDVAAGKPDALLADAVAIGRAQDEGWRVRRDGSRLWAGGVITPLLSPVGALAGFASIMRDLTERRRADDVVRALLERERETADRLRALDRMKSESVAMVAHDMGTPLTTVKGYVEIVLEGWDRLPEADKRDLLERASRGAGNLTALLGDLVEVERIGSGGGLELEIAPFDLVAVLEQAVLEALPPASAGRIRLHVPDRACVALGDQRRVRQVVVNLLSNAVKFSPVQDPIEVGVAHGPEEVEVSVRDHGAGIALEDQRRVFDRFTRLPQSGAQRVKGTGLGLYLARSLVEAQGGRIWVESEPGLGATFRFTLPAAAQERPND